MNDPKAQAQHDYKTGGGLDDCPASYNLKQKESYKWEMHRLQRDELERMRESV